MSYLLGLKKIASWIKKIFIIFIVYLGVIYLFFYFINKDKVVIKNNPIEENRKKIYQNINNPQLTKTQEGKMIVLFYKKTLCILVGEACSNNPSDGDKNFFKSIFGFISNLIIFPYINPPASGIYWAYSGLKNAGFIPKTYAAEGIGFASIKPFMNIWKTLRDVSYMILVLILISIGFMIMFRMKLNSQTIISLENALPKIVISLILITFSFAIAGFLIDIMYLIVIISISIFSNNNTLNLNQNDLLKNLTQSGFTTLLFNALRGYDTIEVGKNFLSIVGEDLSILISNIIGLFVSFLVSTHLLPPITYTIGKFFENVAVNVAGFGVNAGGTISSILQIIFSLLVTFLGVPIFLPFFIGFLILLTILLLVFRIFFILLMAYLRIIFYIILSPIFLIFEAIPGKNVFTNWLKNLFAEVMTFALVIIIFLISYLITQQFQINEQYNLWLPPFLYNISPNLFPSLIGLGVLLIIPQFIKMFKESLGAKGIGIEIGIGNFFEGASSLLGGAQAGLGTFTSFTQAPFIGPWLHEKARKDKGPLAQVLKGMLGKSQAETFAEILEEKGIIGGSKS